MARLAVRRRFPVEVAVETAWKRLVEVERWPEWAPHIRRVTVHPPGPLGPDSTGVLQLVGLGRNAFEVTVWDPPARWEWVGRLPGVEVRYDHAFHASSSHVTLLEWVVRLEGPLTPLVRPAFSRVYGRKVDRAIPNLQGWITG